MKKGSIIHTGRYYYILGESDFATFSSTVIVCTQIL